MRVHTHSSAVRRFAPALAVVAVIAAIVGHNAGATEARQTATSKQVVVAGWGGPLQAAEAAAYFKPFEKATGIKVVQDLNPLAPKVKAQVDAGQPKWDIITTGYAILFQLGGKYFEPIQYGKYKAAYADIPKALKTKYAVAGDQFCYAPAYRTDVLTDPSKRPQTWADFWNYEKFPGKRGMALDGGVPWNSTEAAWLAAGNPPSSLKNMDPKAVMDQFTALKPAIGKWWGSGAEAMQLLANKEVDMEIAPVGPLYTLAKQGIPVEVAWKQAVCGFNNWYVLKGARNASAAQQLIAYMMNPARQGKFASLSAYGVSNPKAIKYVKSKTLQKYLPIGKNPIVADQLPRNRWWGKYNDTIVEEFNKWRLSG